MSLLIKELLSIAANRFSAVGCMTPRLDAEVLLAHLLHVDKSFFFIHGSDPLDERRSELYFQLVDQRASGIPVQYLTGIQEFMGLPFTVNEHVLIPRPDTETLVEKAIQVIKASKRVLHKPLVLDLCCGSGAIAVSLAHHCPEAQILAVDISAEALAAAKENAERNGVKNRVRFLQADLFAPQGKGGKIGKFDCIVSNPPYIPSAVIPTLQREVAQHEPLLALDGGADGLDFYRRIIAEAPDHLRKGGTLLLEIGHDQAPAIKELIAASGRYQEEVTVIADLAGHDRCIQCQA